MGFIFSKVSDRKKQNKNRVLQCHSWFSVWLLGSY